MSPYYKIRKYLKAPHGPYRDIDHLVDSHFTYWSTSDALQRKSFLMALNEISLHTNPQLIETGTSAWGCDSTRLLDEFVKFCNGNLQTVDIRKEPRRNLRFQLSRHTQTYVSDSVLFLDSLSKRFTKPIDLLFLDSYDLDWDCPEPSATHTLNELRAARNLLVSGSLVLVDDTPLSPDLIPERFRESALDWHKMNGIFPGKGSYVVQLLKKFPRHFTVLNHDYTLLFRVNETLKNMKI